MLDQQRSAVPWHAVRPAMALISQQLWRGGFGRPEGGSGAFAGGSGVMRGTSMFLFCKAPCCRLPVPAIMQLANFCTVLFTLLLHSLCIVCCQVPCSAVHCMLLAAHLLSFSSQHCFAEHLVADSLCRQSCSLPLSARCSTLSQHFLCTVCCQVPCITVHCALLAAHMLSHPSQHCFAEYLVADLLFRQICSLPLSARCSTLSLH